ncbi:unnamed protein product [Urochloa decumbens]|uniref:Uncharacterized protein n=1 Tax=Urochloa decumbens TaxID=240449 RepID=A0ABC8W3B6_9POAL
MGNCACQSSRCRHDDAEGAPWTDGGVEPAAAWAERRRPGGEVTVRISKRRLQQLMAEAAGGGADGGMTVEKVLAEIVSAGEVVDGRHRRRWEPALPSIREAVES